VVALWLGCYWIALVIALSMPHDAIALETPMDQHLPVYSWLRGGASLHLAQIADIAIRPGPAGQQQTSVRVRIMRTLWGLAPDPVTLFDFLEPISETSRLKFPHPVWGRVDLAARPPILLVLRAEATGDQPWYVEPAPQRDPAFAALIDIVQAETPGTERPDQRVRRYVDWLQPSRHPALRLFAAEALAKDDDLPGVDPSGRMAAEFARVFQTDPDTYVRLAVGTWMWGGIWQKTNSAGRSAIADSAVDGLRDADEDISRFCLRHLLALDAPDLIQSRSAGAAQILRNRYLRNADPGERTRIEALIRRISP
jgi:hypothetical protein